MARLFTFFLQKEEGVTAIEYSFIAIGIAVVIALSVTSLGASIADVFARLDFSATF